MLGVTLAERGFGLVFRGGGDELGEPGERHGLVVVLAAALADPDRQLRGPVPGPDRARGGVDVLATWAAASITAQLDVGRIQRRRGGCWRDHAVQSNAGKPALAMAAVATRSRAASVVDQLVSAELISEQLGERRESGWLALQTQADRARLEFVALDAALEDRQAPLTAALDQGGGEGRDEAADLDGSCTRADL